MLVSSQQMLIVIISEAESSTFKTSFFWIQHQEHTGNINSSIITNEAKIMSSKVVIVIVLLF